MASSIDQEQKTYLLRIIDDLNAEKEALNRQLLVAHQRIERDGVGTSTAANYIVNRFEQPSSAGRWSHGSTSGGLSPPVEDVAVSWA